MICDSKPTGPRAANWFGPPAAGFSAQYSAEYDAPISGGIRRAACRASHSRATAREARPTGGVWYTPVAVTDSFLAARPRPQRSYVRTPVPIHFPDSAEMPETGVHLEVRTALYLLVRDFVGERGAVGSDQFVYWDPSD